MANRIETGLNIKGLSGDTNALHVTGNSFINGDVNITGNVNVIGTATTLNTETVQTRDNRILLNYSGTTLSAIGGGIEVLSGKTNGTNISLTTDSNGDWNSNTGLNISGRTSDNTTYGLRVQNNGGTDNLVIRNDGNVGIGTSSPTRILDSRGTFNLQPSTNTFLRFDSYMIEAQVGSSSNALAINIDNFGGSQLRGSGSSGLVSGSNSFGITSGGLGWFRIDDKLIFSYSDNYVIGWWDLQNSRFRIGGGGYSPIYSSTTETFEVIGTSKISGNVGIGITGSTDVNTKLKIVGTDSSSNYGLKVQNSGGTDNLVVRNDGNVGIGTSSPISKLHIKTTQNLTSNIDYFLLGSDISNYFIRAHTNGYGSYETSSLKFATYGGDINFTLGSNAQNNFNVKHSIFNNEFNVGGGSFYSKFYHGGFAQSDGIIDESYFTGSIIPSRKTTKTIISNNEGGTLADTYEGLRIRKGNWVNTSGTTYYPLIALDGNVGIGTATPNAKLTIESQSGITYPLSVSSVNVGLTRSRFLNAGGNQTDIQIGNNNGGNSLYLGLTNTSIPYLDNRTSNNFEYQIVGIPKVTIDTSGNVGIGTSTPGFKLQVINDNNTVGIETTVDGSSTPLRLTSTDGGFSDNQEIRIDTYQSSSIVTRFATYYDSSTTWGFKFYGTNSFLNSQPIMTLNGNGNVGIGTTSPTAKLDISGNTGYNQLRLRTSYTPTSSSDTSGNVGDIAWDDNYFYWKTSSQWLRVSGQTF